VRSQNNEKRQLVSSCRSASPLARSHATIPLHWTDFHESWYLSILWNSVENSSFISFNLVVCLTTGPKPLPKRALHIVRSRATSFKWEYPLLSLRSSNSFLRLLHCLPVTSIPPCIFPSVTRCRRQFRRKMWQVSLSLTKIPGISNDVQYMFVFISRCVLVRIGNGSDKNNRIETHVLCWIFFFFSRVVPSMR
jgi:hypothetical protein